MKTHIYDALIEQNSFYLGAEGANETVAANNEKLRQLDLTKEEWRRAFQFIFIKAAQTEALQANHQFTPDAIGFILMFLIENLTASKELDVLEIGSGTGNLAQTLLNNSSKDLNYLGIVLKKQAEHTPETFVYPLADLQSREALTDFIEKFKKWNVENMIF